MKKKRMTTRRKFKVCPEERYKIIGLRVSADTFETLQAMADDKGLSLSPLCRGIILQHLTQGVENIAA